MQKEIREQVQDSKTCNFKFNISIDRIDKTNAKYWYRKNYFIERIFRKCFWHFNF